MAFNQGMCRTCLKTSKKSFNLYSNLDSDKLISDVLMEETSIKIHQDDGLPEKICDSCLKKLHLVREFKALVVDSDTKLHNLLTNDKDINLENESVIVDNIKEEISDEPIDPLLVTTDDVSFTNVPSDTLIEENSASVSGVKSFLQSEEIKEWENTDDITIKNEFPDNAEHSQEKSIEKSKENVTTTDKDYDNSDMEDNDLTSVEGISEVKSNSDHIKEESLDGQNIPNISDSDCSSSINEGSLEKKNQQKRVFCKLCSIFFENRHHFNAHIYKHAGGTSYKYDINKIGYKRWITTSNLCNICGKTFKYEENLEIHKSSHSEAVPYKCEKCGSTYKSESDLQAHLLTHNAGDMSCSICGKYVKTEKELNRHTRLLHHKCNNCGKVFETKLLLEGHKLIHTNTANLHVCKICSAAFRDPDMLAQHIRIHTDEYLHACHLCPTSFKYAHLLDKHMALHKVE